MIHLAVFIVIAGAVVCGFLLWANRKIVHLLLDEEDEDEGRSRS